MYVSMIWVCFGVNQLILSQLKTGWGSGVSLHADFTSFASKSPLTPCWLPSNLQYPHTSACSLAPPTCVTFNLGIKSQLGCNLMLMLFHVLSTEKRKTAIMILPHRGPRRGPSQAQCSTSKTQCRESM